MTGKDRIHAAAKCTVSTAALLFFLFCREKKTLAEALLTVLALAFCIAGDFFLALSGELERRQHEPQFTLGIASFAAAHVFFCALSVSLCSFKNPALLFLILPAALLIPYLSRRKVLRPGKYQRRIAVYGVFVGFMAVLSLQLLVSGSAAAPAGAGGLLFWCSDLLLSFWYFCKKEDGKLRTPFALGGAALAVYWAGIWIICLYA